MRSYFPNKNYAAIYLNRIGDEFAGVLLSIFTGVYFLIQGMALHFILLYYGLLFLTMGLFSPLGPWLVSRYSVLRAVALSYLLTIINFILISLSEKSLTIGFLSFFFYGFSRAIYYPVMDGLRITLIREGTRGKQISLEIVFISITSIIAVGAGTYILKHFSYIYIVFIVAIVLILSLIPLGLLQPLKIQKTNFKEPYKYFLSKKYRENIVPLGAFAFPIIALVILPLFIFSLVGELTQFGIIIILAISLEVIVTLLFGKVIDRREAGKTQKMGALAHAMTLTLFFLFAKTPLSIITLNPIHKISWNMAFSSFVTRIYKKAKKTRVPFIIGSCIQLNLCSVEIVTLSLFSVFAFFFGKVVFLVIGIFAIVGLYFSSKYFKD